MFDFSITPILKHILFGMIALALVFAALLRDSIVPIIRSTSVQCRELCVAVSSQTSLFWTSGTGRLIPLAIF